ncbi:MAG: MFS transporter [Alicyclobacillus sp.]|nr:MFS transporter [Alicyclobacillus sp.]
MSHRQVFIMLAYTFFFVAFGTNVPAPLYAVYRETFHLSAGMITLIFAVYALCLIPSLLVAGQMSDGLGRKRMFIIGVWLALAGSLLLAFARGLMSLVAGRAVQGIAAGLLNSTLTAALVEFHPKRNQKRASFVATATMAAGTAAAPLISGLLAQYGPYPLLTPYLLHAAFIFPSALCGFAMPDTKARAGVASWKIRWPYIPPAIRKPVSVSAWAALVCWAVVALFMSLVPASVDTLLHTSNLAVAGFIPFAIFLSSSITQFIWNHARPTTYFTAGFLFLVIGLGTLLVAISVTSLALLAAASILCGVGHGLTFMGSMVRVNEVAPPARRGEVVSLLYIFAYVGVGIPIIGLGFLSQGWGTLPTITVFFLCILIISSFLWTQSRKVQ